MKKHDGSSYQTTFEFVAKHYGAQETNFGVNLLRHAEMVSKQAEVIAQRLYQDVRADIIPDDSKDSIAAIMQGALLHDILNVRACAFENIAEISTVQIAAMVADISRDFRLVETKRDMEFRGRLASAPVGSQIIVVADVICTARDILQALQQLDMAAVPRARKLLTQLDGDLLAIHAASRYYILRMYVHAARNMLTDVSQAIKTCKQKAKNDKAMAQLKMKLRDKLSSEKSPAPTKKKDVHYARKRSVDQDS